MNLFYIQGSPATDLKIEEVHFSAKEYAVDKDVI